MQPLSSLATPLIARSFRPVVAAIDIGTNSIHMAIVRVDPSLPAFDIISREKSTVRLGERDPETGDLTEAGMARAIAALRRCYDLAISLQVDEIIAVATSAVREAPNGRDFLRRVAREVGINVNEIAGPEEARRIYLGVLSSMELGGKPHAIIDIGGGSTELILGDGREPLYLSSTKVGAVRLTTDFIHTDPVTEADYQALRAYARGMLERAVEELHGELAKHPLAAQLTLVATSGTAECLAAIHAAATTGNVPSPLQGCELPLAALREWVDRLRHMSLEERSALPEMSDRRAEIIVAGAVVLQEAMDLLGVDRLVVCERSLREGVIVDWMLQHQLIDDRLRFQSSVRERSALALAKKYQVNLTSAQHVAAIALTLFDQTQGLLHQWDETARELLWAAAVLHHCGHHVGHDAHHKHAYYLIRHGQLLGYTETEIEVIANLARYHRKSAPKKRHEGYQALAGKRYRQMVDELSPILRLAAALDRRQIQAVRRVQCQFRPPNREFRLLLEPANPLDDCAIERWSLDCEAAVFQSQVNVDLMAVMEPCAG
ncbi:MAG TPA: Ppx/GppA phosphatase family protein [Coleofasciculaceae cyanobacterium]